MPGEALKPACQLNVFVHPTALCTESIDHGLGLVGDGCA
jgi:hypothetical protein